MEKELAPIFPTFSNHKSTNKAREVASSFLKGTSNWTNYDVQIVRIMIEAVTPGKVTHERVTMSLNESYSDLMHSIKELFGM